MVSEFTFGGYVNSELSAGVLRTEPKHEVIDEGDLLHVLNFVKSYYHLSSSASIAYFYHQITINEKGVNNSHCDSRYHKL